MILESCCPEIFFNFGKFCCYLLVLLDLLMLLLSMRFDKSMRLSSDMPASKAFVPSPEQVLIIEVLFSPPL